MRKTAKASIPKSYTIGSEAGVGIVDATRGTDPANNPSLLSGPMPPRPAVIAQGNWKFVEQLLQVRENPWGVNGIELQQAPDRQNPIGHSGGLNNK